MKAQGWYRDPYLVHEDRYFSDGQPTKLVRDGDAEAYDPPPPGQPKLELVGVPESPDSFNSNELRRADDLSVGPARYDRTNAFWAALDSVVIYGPIP